MSHKCSPKRQPRASQQDTLTNSVVEAAEERVVIIYYIYNLDFSV